MSEVLGTMIFVSGVAAGITRSERLFWSFLVAGALFIPLRSGLVLNWTGCELSASGPEFASSLTNTRHLFLFAVLTLIASRQHRLAWPHVIVITLNFGLILEVSQALFASGHCRLRDLVPDGLGMVLALTTQSLVRAVRIRMQPRPSLAVSDERSAPSRQGRSSS